ncbi:MAG: hypothetical protein ACPGXY_03100 [Alphaproteobacteria bacterium]
MSNKDNQQTDWAAVRADYYSNVSMAQLSRKYGIPISHIKNKKEADGWFVNPKAEVQAKARAKALGIDLKNADDDALLQAIEDESDAMARVERRHRTELDTHAKIVDPIYQFISEAGDAAEKVERMAMAEKPAKVGKTLAEIIRIRHAAERKAWNLDEEDTSSKAPSNVTFVEKD